MSTMLMKSDAELKAEVLNELRWDAVVDETGIRVNVRDGIATLSGHVSSYAKKMAARDAAHRVHGVLDVVDEVTIRMPVESERSDELLAQAVRHALQWDALVPDQKITTTVSNGYVTLMGAVDKWSERFHAERAVENLVGTKGVINRITISAPAVDPAEIKLEIDRALERRAHREARHISVTVRDGIATLTGVVRSWGERNAVERAVWGTTGICRVDDRTTVDPYQ